MEIKDQDWLNVYGLPDRTRRSKKDVSGDAEDAEDAEDIVAALRTLFAHGRFQDAAGDVMGCAHLSC